MDVKTIKLPGKARLKAYVPDSEIGYRIHRKRPGIILAPGGAYLLHAVHEMEGVALEFLAKGYNVYVLEYSVGISSREYRDSGATELDTPNRYPLPVLELMEAVHFVKTHSEELNLNPTQLFLMGFSAGGHLCASYGVFWNSESFTSQLSFKPKENELRVSGMVLGYPLINPWPDIMDELRDLDNNELKLLKEFIYDTQNPTQEQKNAVNLILHVTPETTPAFIWHSIDDPLVPSMDSTLFVYELQKNGVPCEYHLFDRGGHGLGLATEIYAEEQADVEPHIAIWTKLAHEWMENQSDT